MDKQLLGQVTAIANGTRSWVEKQAAFTNYYADTLMGWCAIASAEMFRQLEAIGIACKLYMSTDITGSCHVFCVVDDYVVDVTATQFHQFKNKKVLILHMKEAEVHEMYQAVDEFTSVSKLKRFQKNKGWPSEQVAYM